MSQHGRINSLVPSTTHSRLTQGRFGRLFRKLPPWSPPGKTEAEQLSFLSALASSMLESKAPSGNRDNTQIPAAYTYFGQFVDHDITFDPTSELSRQNDPDSLVNFRSPAFDLDNIYGGGPDLQPYLYQHDDRNAFLIGKGAGEGEADLPRNAELRALIADPRNDENIIVAQLHLQLLGLHNHFLQEAVTKGMSGKAAFEDARRQTRWHYQWVVVQDFLKRLCGADLVDSLLNLTTGFPAKPNLKIYKFSNNPFLPVEFSVAAYRLGHSMVRQFYQLNDKLTELRQNNGIPPIVIFSANRARDNLENLNGFRQLPPLWTIQWDRFLKFGGSTPQASRKLDPFLADALANLPGENPASLPFRNLVRGWRMGLPSGQAVARFLGIDQVVRPKSNDPLWQYILEEAESLGAGTRLGPVGARIVGEVFVGLLAADPTSFYSVEPTWRPQIVTAGGSFGLAELLALAGAPMKVQDLPF